MRKKTYTRLSSGSHREVDDGAEGRAGQHREAMMLVGKVDRFDSEMTL